MQSWTHFVCCAVCWELDQEHPLSRQGDHLFCSACRTAGRRRLSVRDDQLRGAWARQVARLHLDRVALAGADEVLRRCNHDEPGRYGSLADGLAELQALPGDELVLLLPALAHRVLWDGAVIKVRWRQPFDFLVDAAVPLVADSDAQVLRWARLAGEHLAVALADAVPSGQGSRADRAGRLLGPCNVLTVPEAIAELGMNKEDGRAWLASRNLIKHPGRERRGSGRVLASELAEAVAATGMYMLALPPSLAGRSRVT